VEIRELDPRTADDEELLALHDLEQRCAPPGWAFRSAAESLAYYRHWPRGIRRRWRAGEAGAAALYVHGPNHTYAEIRVAPEYRRRGVGTELLAVVREAAREEGAPSFFSHHWDEAGAAFAARAGAVDDQRDVGSTLELKRAELPPPLPPPGYVLRSWIGPAPEDLVESFVLARRSMDDAPTPGGQQFENSTVESLREDEATAARRGREVRVTVALDADRTVVAFTDLRAAPPPSRVATTDDTATVPAVRRQGLSTAVKLESLRRLRDERPDVEVVTTMNAEHNVAMRAVNAKIGFVPRVTLTTTVISL
jgi:mycothiol synthase